MTININMAKSLNFISNPDKKPLEELFIKTHINGELKSIPALDHCWVSEGRIFTQYFPPLLNDPNDDYPIGAKEDWLERLSYLQADLKWLLGLSHHRFWSQVVIGEDSLIGVESFLQEATPFYVTKSFPNDSKMIEEYKKIQHLVFLVLIRLSTQKESEIEWISKKKISQFWYDKYLITLPLMLDMCLLYSNSNRAELTNMFNGIFTIQPLYYDDIKTMLSFVDERISTVQEKINANKNNNINQHVKLNDGTTTTSPGKRSDFTLLSLSDLILYLLDTAVNLSSFLSVHQPACEIFHDYHFENRIVSVYENTIPSMFRELDLLAKKDDTIDVYFDLKFKLDFTRHELLNIFRNSSYSTMNKLIVSSNTMSEDDIKSCVDNYMSDLSEFLSDKAFIQDYNKGYPVDLDLNMLSQICPELDSIKCDFLLESVLSCYDVTPKIKPKPEPTCISSNNVNEYAGPSSSSVNNVTAKNKVKGVELESLISQVKDIMPHLGDGFVQKCLEYYEYNSASVVNAIFESTLPEPLECLDIEMPAFSDDIGTAIENNDLPDRANVFDNDEFDIMTRDYIDTSKVHRGKWKHGNKSINEILNDKSHIIEFKETYSKLGIVTDEVDVNLYEDEYDDTYDGLDVGVKEPDEPDRRPFVTPRILQPSSANNGLESEESSEESILESNTYDSHFVENPEIVRARLEERRRQKYNRNFKPPPSRDVVGKPKGQGQSTNVTKNRDYKHTHKSTFANHNRRSGAQRKRNQGMMPS